MDDDNHTAGPGPQLRRSRTRGGFQKPAQAVSGVTWPTPPAFADLTTGANTGSAHSAVAPLPVHVVPAGARGDGGRFKRGGPSPNPGGRPAVAPEVKEAAQAHTFDMLAVLVSVAKDEGAPPAARVTAANAVLDRGHGKPVTNVDARVATVDMNAAYLAALEELAHGPTAPPPNARPLPLPSR